MVQFHPPPGEFSAARDYWKMPVTEAEEDCREKLKHVKFLLRSMPTDWERLAYLCSRVERGLIIYETYPYHQLEGFIRARSKSKSRGSKLKICGSPKKGDLICALEVNDEDETTFNRVLDLPPELRANIYDYYIQWLSDRYTPNGQGFTGLTFVPAPPIASVSRLLRKETLSLWFSRFRFTIKINNTANPYGTLTRSPEGDYMIKDLTRNFIERAPFHHVQMVRKLHIDGKVLVRYLYAVDEWDVDFKVGEKGVVIKSKEFKERNRPHTHVSRQDLDVTGDLLEKEMRVLIGRIGKRVEGMRLRRGDAEACLNVFRYVQNATLTL